MGALQRFWWDDQTLAVQGAGAHLYITVLTTDLVRVELVPDGIQRATNSYAVVRQEWPPCPVEVTEDPDRVVLRTSGNELTVEVAKNPLRVTIRRGDGSFVAGCAGDGGLRWGGDMTQWRMAAPGGWRYYGFGQKLGHLEKRGRRMEQWATDEPLHILEHDALYQAIPFFLTLEPTGGRSTGVLVDCTARVTHDVAKTEPDVCTVTLAGAPLDAYVFAGPGPKEVLGRYTDLTGRMELPPLWALGYHQSRYSYESAEQVRRIAREMRSRDIPCDVIHLDIDYMDGYRVFTWDKDRFPDPKGLVAELAADGFRAVTIIDPGVKLDGQYAVFRDGIAGGHFICHPDGELYVGTVWPGPTVFPDFTRAGTRRWWGDLHRELVQEVGIAGIWNDMNEPSCFNRQTVPDTVMQGEDGARVPHAKVHNAYGMTMCMATHSGLRRLLPERRPFVLTRSGYAGVQRYAAVWMGDNHSWWEHLMWSMPVCMGMGLSGVPFVGVDIGGFSDDCHGEMLARWTQMGALLPFCRNHTRKGSVPQEPWAFGPEVEAVCRDYLRLRYQLLPFLYNEFYKASQTGLPIMRPLMLDYPEDPATHYVSDQFLVGQDLLVCPVYQPGATARMVYLPAGTWVDFWTGQRVQGPAHVVADAPLHRMPMYVRDGAILPMERPIRHTGERDGRELSLHVYAGAAGRLELYEDAGEGYGYRDGEFALTTFGLGYESAGAGQARPGASAPGATDPEAAGAAAATGPGEARVRLEVGAPQGGFRPPRERVTVYLYCPGAVQAITVNGQPVQWTTGGHGAATGDAAGESSGQAAAAGSATARAAGMLAQPGPASAVVTVETPGAAGFVLEATVAAPAGRG